MTDADIDQMSMGELRRLVAEAVDVPDRATFSVTGLNRGRLLLAWEEPAGSGEFTGMHLSRRCTCQEPDCPDPQ